MNCQIGPDSDALPASQMPSKTSRRVPPWWIVAAAIVLTCLPLIVYARSATSMQNWDAAYSWGDGGTIEMCTFHAARGEQLLGTYSRFHFCHPGPLYFYLLAPLYAASGQSVISLYLSAILINLLVTAAILLVTWRAAGRWACLGCALALSVFLRYLGNSHLTSFSTAEIPALAFILTVVCLAAVVLGRGWCLPWAALVGSFVIQAHLSYTVAVCIMAAATICLVRFQWVRKAVGLSPAPPVRWPVFAVTGIVLLGAWALPLAEQFTSPNGNLWAIGDFILGQNSRQNGSTICRTVGLVLSALPMSLGGLSGKLPTPSALVAVLACVQLILLPIVWRLARRRRDDLTVACLFSALLLVAIIMSVRKMAHPWMEYLVFWMTVLGFLMLLVLGGAGVWLLGRVRLLGARWAPLAAGIVMVGLTGAASLNHMAKMSPAPTQVEPTDPPPPAPAVTNLASVLANFLKEKHVSRIHVRTVDRDTWPWTAALLPRLLKEGLTCQVDPEWIFMFGSQHAPTYVNLPMVLVCDKNSQPILAANKNLTLIGENETCHVYWCPRMTADLGQYWGGNVGLLASQYDGFNMSDSEGKNSSIWATGLHSSMRLKLQAGKFYRLAFRVKSIPLKTPSQTIKVLANGQSVAELQLPDDLWHEFEVALPAQADGQDTMVELQYRHCERIRTLFKKLDDQMQIAVSYEWFELRPGE